MVHVDAARTQSQGAEAIPGLPQAFISRSQAASATKESARLLLAQLSWWLDKITHVRVPSPRPGLWSVCSEQPPTSSQTAPTICPYS